MNRLFVPAVCAVLASVCPLGAAPRKAAVKPKTAPAKKKAAPVSASPQQVLARLQFTVLRPRFLLRDGRTLQAGTAFIARSPRSGKPILITALHLLGPDGGNTTQIPINRVGSEVVQVRAQGFASGAFVATARRCVSVRGFVGNGVYLNDCVAWEIEKMAPGIVPLPLATRDLKSGDAGGEVAWIAGNTYENSASGVRLYRGVGWLEDSGEASARPEEEFEVRGFSGAPILNRRGEVVGMVSASDSANTTYGAPVGRVHANVR